MRAAPLFVLVLLLFPLRPARGEVLGASVGLDVNCPYGMAA